jgi:hypothetical protein
MVRNYRSNGPKWLMGTIVEQIGPVTYDVKIDGITHKRHVDQLRERYKSTSIFSPGDTNDSIRDNFVYPELPNSSSDMQGELPTRRYPSRDRRPPDRYTPSMPCSNYDGRKCNELSRMLCILCF